MTKPRSPRRVVPKGALPAILWSTEAPRCLRLVDGELWWLTTSADRASVWTVPSTAVGRDSPRRLAQPEASHVYALAVTIDRVLVGLPEGLGAVARSGACGLSVVARFEPTFRSGPIMAIAAVGGQTLVAGHAPGGVYLARVVGQRLSLVWDRATGPWEPVSMAATPDGRAWLVGGRELHRYDGDRVRPLPGAPAVERVALAGGRLLASTAINGDLVELDQATGSVRRTIAALPVELTSVVDVGGWTCIAVRAKGHTEILAVSPGGGEPRSLLLAAGSCLPTSRQVHRRGPRPWPIHRDRRQRAASAALAQAGRDTARPTRTPRARAHRAPTGAHVPCRRQGRHARYLGSRKNEFDLRRASAVSNLEIIQRLLEAPPTSAARSVSRAA